jgi:hypothetical protein
MDGNDPIRQIHDSNCRDKNILRTAWETYVNLAKERGKTAAELFYEEWGTSNEAVTFFEKVNNHDYTILNDKNTAQLMEIYSKIKEKEKKRFFDMENLIKLSQLEEEDAEKECEKIKPIYRICAAIEDEYYISNILADFHEAMGLSEESAGLLYSAILVSANIWTPESERKSTAAALLNEARYIENGKKVKYVT